MLTLISGVFRLQFQHAHNGLHALVSLLLTPLGVFHGILRFQNFLFRKNMETLISESFIQSMNEAINE